MNFVSGFYAIDKAMLFEPPLVHACDQGFLGVFDEVEAVSIIRLFISVNSRTQIR